MSAGLESRFETTDGSRPEATTLDEKAASTAPLIAFQVLRGGDVFEPKDASPPEDGVDLARQWLKERVRVKRHFTKGALKDRVLAEMTAQLSGNLALIERMRRAKPLVVDIVPAGKALSRYGYPENVVESAAGLFWDHPSWPNARIALRAEHLEIEGTLVAHELGHAIHYLAFTHDERELVYKVLRPTFGSRAAMDEVFAIYTERELCEDFTEAERRAPGIYGITRRAWNEDHLFTRFVRKLYFPYKPLAGKEAREREAGRKWTRFSVG